MPIMTTMAEFKKLKSYLSEHSSSFPKLVPALKALSEFVGHDLQRPLLYGCSVQQDM